VIPRLSSRARAPDSPRAVVHLRPSPISSLFVRCWPVTAARD
jgi:hypothetical protein